MIRINLAPPPTRPRSRHARRLGMVMGLAALLLVAIGLGLARFLTQEEQQLAQTITDTTRELTVLREMLRGGDEVRNDVAELTKRIHSIESLMHRRATTVSILDALLDVIPDDLRIKTLEGRGREIRATGTTRSAGSVVTLLTGLRASGKFTGVDLVVARQDAGENPDSLLFEITCRFDG